MFILTIFLAKKYVHLSIRGTVHTLFAVSFVSKVKHMVKIWGGEEEVREKPFSSGPCSGFPSGVGHRPIICIYMTGNNLTLLSK